MYKKSSSNLGMQLIIALLLAVIAYLLFTKQTNAAAGGTLSKEEVQAVVKDYISNNPEAILASLQQMQERKVKDEEENAKKILQEKKAEIEDRTTSPVAGNPQGDVTVIEFFDYNCGYCKRLVPVISQFLAEEKDVALVLKEFPILGQASMKASEVALAVYAIDKEKYFKLHDILMTATDLNSEDAIIGKAVALGIDKDELKKQMEKPEIEAAIKKNRELANQIGIRGTPAFIINGELIPGAADVATLREKVAAARAQAKK